MNEFIACWILPIFDCLNGVGRLGVRGSRIGAPFMFTLSLYRYRTVRRRRESSIEVKLAALAFAHRTAGRPDPTVYEAVRAVMTGIRRELRRALNKKEPATLAEIETMLAAIDAGTLKGKRDRALLLVGFAGAFRRSELEALIDIHPQVAAECT